MTATLALIHAWDEDDRRRPVAPLPDPEAFIRNLARGILDVRAGVREPAQLIRFLDQEPYRALVSHSLTAARARRGSASTARPTHHVLSVRWTSPAPDAIEASAVVTTPGRVRAVSIRLGAFESRWRATEIVVV